MARRGAHVSSGRTRGVVRRGAGREEGGEGFGCRKRRETCHLARSPCAFSVFLEKRKKGEKKRDLPLSEVGAIRCRLEHRLCIVWCVPALEGRGGRGCGCDTLAHTTTHTTHTHTHTHTHTGPRAGSSSIFLTISIDSGMAKPSAGICGPHECAGSKTKTHA